MPSMRNVLLLGATGLVGRELLTRLLDDATVARVVVLARRATGRTHAKLDERLIDLPSMNESHFAGIDQIVCALGTTMKTAGSAEHFRLVDHDLPLLAARHGLAAGAHHYLLVSALGANRHSRFFYNRVKGEMQAAIAQLGHESIVIAQPSLLLGDRAALGQPARSGEIWAARLLGPLGWIVPKAVRPIPARAVASALLAATLDTKPGVRFLKSEAMQARDQP